MLLFGIVLFDLVWICDDDDDDGDSYNWVELIGVSNHKKGFIQLQIKEEEKSEREVVSQATLKSGKNIQHKLCPGLVFWSFHNIGGIFSKSVFSFEFLESSRIFL